MTLLGRYDDILARILAALRRHYGARLVSCAVFGSVGRGTPREDSDVDLVIVARALPDGRFRRMAQFAGIEAELAPFLAPRAAGAAPIELSPVFRTPEELEVRTPLFLDLVEDARILYDPEGLLAGFLDRLRARLGQLGARRVWRGNAWYWDLKPDYRPGEVFSL